MSGRAIIVGDNTIEWLKAILKLSDNSKLDSIVITGAGKYTVKEALQVILDQYFAFFNGNADVIARWELKDVVERCGVWQDVQIEVETDRTRVLAGWIGYIGGN